MHLPSSQPIFLTSTVIIPYCLLHVHPKHYPLFLVVSAVITPYHTNTTPYFLLTCILIMLYHPPSCKPHLPNILLIISTVSPVSALTIPYHLPNIHINYTVPSHSWTSWRPLSKRFSSKNTLCIPCLHHSTYLLSPS